MKSIFGLNTRVQPFVRVLAFILAVIMISFGVSYLHEQIEKNAPMYIDNYHPGLLGIFIGTIALIVAVRGQLLGRIEKEYKDDKME
jgi:hypothetical protein